VSQTVSSQSWLLLVLVLICFSLPAPTRADAEEEFRQLDRQCWELKDKGKLKEAERLALELKRMAEGPLADNEDRMADALNTLGAVYCDQGRYAEAEPLYRRSLAIREKSLGPEHPDVAASLNNLANLYDYQGQYANAQRIYRRSLAIKEKVLGPEHPEVAASLHNLAILYYNQGRYSEAESLYKRSLVIKEKSLGPQHRDVADTLNGLALLYCDQARYAEAEPLYERSLAIREKVLGPEHPDVAASLNNLAILYYNQGRYAEAEPLYKRSLAISEKALGQQHPEVAASLHNLAILYVAQGRYAEAEPLYKRSLVIKEKALGPQHRNVADTLNSLALLYCAQARYAEAEPLYERSLAISEKVLGPEHPDVAASLNNLANLYDYQGQYANAQRIYRRSLAIKEKVLGPEHPEVAASLHNLAILYYNQGRYSEAESLYKRSLAIREKAFGPEHPYVAVSLNNLAVLYKEQGRYVEAEMLYQSSLLIRKKTLGAGSPAVARSLHNIATLYHDQGRHAEAEVLYKRSLALTEKALGRNHPDVGTSLNNLGSLYLDQGRYAEAAVFLRRSLAIRENALGRDHPDVASSLNNLANLYKNRGQYAEAKALIDRSIEIRDRLGTAAAVRKQSYWLRADLCWAQRQTDSAVANLREAMNLAEEVRVQASGGEQERAVTFARQIFIFEKMVAWQGELERPSECLDALERSRARGLLDQIETRGLDLLAGVQPEEARRLRQNDAQARGRLAALRKQLQLLDSRKDLSAVQKKERTEQLVDGIRQARWEVAEAYATIRNASPAYRLAVGKDLKPVPLEAIQAWVTKQNALLLEYLAGTEGGYVLIVPPEGKTRLEKLAINAIQAKILGVDVGPLTGKRLSAALSDEKGAGVLDRLRKADSPEGVQEVASALAVLWEVLIPEKERQAILKSKYKRLIVLPDGALAKLPFETLVVEKGDTPKYLLDVGPAIEYAPSATILMNLAERRERSGLKDVTDREPVLMVGDCRYPQSAEPAPDNALAQLAPRARAARLGGRFEPLVYSRWEISWVSQVFGEKGTKVAVLEGQQATEAAVRLNAPGRRLLLFSCHGFIDESYGNLFGALALTPGPNQDDPADDGFLTLAEVYGMNLKGCELAILSACDTNVGPQQRGEGVWALSRGFLVAGARRVLASNWPITDRDESAASFVSYFTSIIAKAEKEGKTPDHVQAVYDAKLFLRRHRNKKWQNPYYWGAFVLIGPD
jgi:tetratricopeptide (TPR) repeat protein